MVRTSAPIFNRFRGLTRRPLASSPSPKPTAGSPNLLAMVNATMPTRKLQQLQRSRKSLKPSSATSPIARRSIPMPRGGKKLIRRSLAPVARRFSKGKGKARAAVPPTPPPVQKKKQAAPASKKKAGTKRARSPAPRAKAPKSPRPAKRQRVAVLPAASELKGLSMEQKKKGLVLRMAMTSQLAGLIPHYSAMGGVPTNGKEQSGRLIFKHVSLEALQWALRDVSKEATAGKAPSTYSMFVKDFLAKHKSEEGESFGDRQRAAAAAWKAASDDVKEKFKADAEAAESVDSGVIYMKLTGRKLRTFGKKVLISLDGKPLHKASGSYLGTDGLHQINTDFTKLHLRYTKANKELRVAYTMTFSHVA